jgi:hypothetical protein
MAEPSNETVFSPPTLMLGEIHWHILRASQLMYEKTVVETRHGERGLFVQQGITDFGKEVGRDEIDWWVFRKEHNLPELRERTSRALDAAQQLKKASSLLGRGERPESYDELLWILRRFVEKHAAEIATLRDYVLWLSARDVLTPKILFTYRVWGSTRMGDRESRFTLGERPNEGEIKGLTEIVLGLTSSIGLTVYFKAEYELGADMYEMAEGADFEIPVVKIVRRASGMAFEECAEYFEFIRDSLRNILLDIDKFVEQRDFVNDDAFWRAFIKKVAQTPKAEPQLWDCKETLTMWHVDKEPERTSAKVTFCEDVASFANARGGVLIIGVTDKREIVGIGSGRELENKLKFAAEVLAKHLEYPRDICRLRQIVVPDRDGADKVCLVVVVAAACEPVGVNDGAGRYTYPVRRETGLTRVARDEILNPKIHIKSDNYDFLREIYQFVHEKQGTN